MRNNCTKFLFYQIERVITIGKNFLAKHNMTIDHYSGIYAFSKAFIHDFLPSNVSRIMVLDVDIIVLDDIYSIWEQFHLFKTNVTALGLVPWYLLVPNNYTYKGLYPDPYISGVILYDMKIIRLINFLDLLDNLTNMASKEFRLKSFWTADQTILSLFAVYFPKYFVTLPCFVNGHTFHYLLNGPTWKSSCKNQYPRTVHVVPSGRLKNPSDYFGRLYMFYKDMPSEWLSTCLTSFNSN
ncbi:unnamed protein product [Adineta steineri]|uniref:Glycosyltransferase-like protein n=1 Tax=Adineta steineri TaxID=433720 RepID=A0A819JYM9_9BILA|nr:unnamed protein product [Adineta steineri]CAF3940109.1 unnamed protein product [Adineta steineri]